MFGRRYNPKTVFQNRGVWDVHCHHGSEGFSPLLLLWQPYPNGCNIVEPNISQKLLQLVFVYFVMLIPKRFLKF